MIRAEIVVKGSAQYYTEALERKVKKAISRAVVNAIDEAGDQYAELVRLQYLGPLPKPRKSTAKRPA